MFSMRALECLVAIVEQRSLTQAAAVLHISQPALSHQIAAIERELGTRVIERLPRGIRPTAAGLAAAATNAAVDAIVAGLAVELAPIRVNAIAPGTIDTGAYDALGDERKAALFQARSAANPARRIGTADDVAVAALAVLTYGFLTGVSIPVDGGEHLV